LTIYKTYFKTILILNTETWTLTKRNKSKIQAWILIFLDVLKEKHEGIELEIKSSGK
jgi:hypothetical protein